MNNDSYTCFSCGFKDPKVECRGIWYCPNALCHGPGGAWFRGTLESHVRHGHTHSVDSKEYQEKGEAYMKEKYPEWKSDVTE